jgi:phage shock protein E
MNKSFIYRTSCLLPFFALVVGLLIACSAPQVRIEPAEGITKVTNGALLVDVRSATEFSSGHVYGALNIPHDQVEARLPEFGEDKSREIVLYCGSGRRADMAREILNSHGYKKVFNAGGYESWPKEKKSSKK